ncbi:DUF427 domain-containing protein [Pseudogemmobacter sp. W21_MBD1_M6]|uniref:DUF427 domain-containing protein n=1 Tax=Pseudogemmobacter sp. W21_MBD1_M6 TaxID=3240271 RepID=UPI003F9A241B
MSDTIKIRKSESSWVVRAGGAILGESSDALELTEGDSEPVIYFPRTDIAMAFLDTSDTTSTCPHKGTASYFSIVTKSTTIRDAAWSYETPRDSAEAIADYLAFYPDKVTVESV